jgi:hypothetical protein
VLADGEPVDVAVDNAPARPRSVETSEGAVSAVRRAGAVWLERRGAPPVRLSDARQIGVPTVAAKDGTIDVAWAERASAKTPWRVRWARVAPGSSEPVRMELPDGLLVDQAMAPAIAVVDDRRVLLAWTEGPVASHAVRAALLDEAGALVGAPLVLSPPGANAGQPQIVLRSDGRGLVGFFAGGRGPFAAYAAALACR